MSSEPLVQAAIIERSVVVFSYEGDSGPPRVGHPHALYFGANAETLVDMYQVAGYSSEALPGWRSFDVEKIAEATCAGDAFEVAPGWDPLSNRYHGGIVAMV